MKSGHFSDIEAIQVTDYGSVGSTIRWLLSKDNGAPNFAMRVITIEPGGFIGMHEHSNEHEIFVLSGCGRAKTMSESVDLGPGDYLLVPENPGLHGFENTGDEVFQFICCIPNPK